MTLKEMSIKLEGSGTKTSRSNQRMETIILTPPAQKSTTVSPGLAIVWTAAAKFSSCWHFLSSLSLGKSPALQSKYTIHYHY